MQDESQAQSPGATPPNPGLFFQTVNAYQRTAAIRAGVELDVFTGIAEGTRTARDLAARCAAAERGVRVLCDALAVMGFLVKEDADRYALTPDSAAFLDRNSPAYAGGIVEFLLSQTLVDAFARSTDAVRKGGTTLAGGGTVEDENPVWVKFARAMAPMMAMPAELLAKLVMGESKQPMRVLDVAAGHGLFGLAFAKLNPAARAVALDWSPVLEVAAHNAKAAGVADRFETIAGSAFDVDLRGPYDVVLLPNFLHHFDAKTCVSFLRKVRAALADAGRAVTLEFIPDEGRAGPPDSVMFALVMLVSTPAGDAYTFAEFQRMFAAAGFSRSRLHELPPTMQRAVISER
jgi:ubiquinone/menaquinone biosynthesis C-methylase UbiE